MNTCLLNKDMTEKVNGASFDVHFTHTINYSKAYRLEVGLSIIFGSKSLTFKR